jgi:hypothetical protein
MPAKKAAARNRRYGNPPQLRDKHPHTLYPRRLFKEPNDGFEVRPEANSLSGCIVAQRSQTA